jgi:hypothetical protein
MKLTILLILLISFSGSIFANDDPPAATECCYTNPDYVGACSVTPSKDETCASILKYLNTAGTVGKTYCGNSRIRGGWKLVACEDKSQQNDKHEHKSDQKQ